MRKIDLRLDSIGFGARGTRRSTRTLRLADRAEMFTYLDRFVVFNGTGMSLLLGDSDFLKYIENSFTLNFQLPCQIVNSNLAHPLFLPPHCPAKSSYQPHGFSFQFRIRLKAALTAFP